MGTKQNTDLSPHGQNPKCAAPMYSLQNTQGLFILPSSASTGLRGPFPSHLPPLVWSMAHPIAFLWGATAPSLSSEIQHGFANDRWWLWSSIRTVFGDASAPHLSSKSLREIWSMCYPTGPDKSPKPPWVWCRCQEGTARTKGWFPPSPRSEGTFVFSLMSQLVLSFAKLHNS